MCVKYLWRGEIGEGVDKGGKDNFHCLPSCAFGISNPVNILPVKKSIN